MNHQSLSDKSKFVKLSTSTLQSLNTYALAAGAAGVGMLALASSSEAKIVYTPTNVVLGPQGLSTYNLDLNQDGITDFVLEKTSSCDVGGCFRYLGGFGKDGEVAFGGKVQGCLAMPAGAVIGPRRMFYGGFVGMAGVFSDSKVTSYRGNWVNVQNEYLGLEFLINGETHYGWARFSVTVQGSNITGTLTGYAYETVANQPIIAGQTKGQSTSASSQEPESSAFVAPSQGASLGLLARGAAGLPIWHHE